MLLSLVRSAASSRDEDKLVVKILAQNQSNQRSVVRGIHRKGARPGTLSSVALSTCRFSDHKTHWSRIIRVGVGRCPT